MSTHPDDMFSLRALIREVCATSTITDPTTLAKEVGRRIPQDALRDALDEALPVVVQHFVSRSRGSIDSLADQGRSDTHNAVVGKAPNRSHKVAAIRAGWQKQLRDRIAVGPDRSDWKFLGDCGRADLAYAAGLRRNHAAANRAAAERLEALAALLTQHRVDRVAELPTTVLAATFEAAA